MGGTIPRWGGGWGGGTAVLNSIREERPSGEQANKQTKARDGWRLLTFMIVFNPHNYFFVFFKIFLQPERNVNNHQTSSLVCVGITQYTVLRA